VNDPVFQDYRLVSLDLPAHGNSGFFSEENQAYSLPGLGGIMANAVRQLANNQPYIIAGVSLGTNIVAEMLAFNLAPAGLVLAGPCIAGEICPVEKIIKPGTHVGVVFTDDPDMQDVAQYARETSLSNEADDLQSFLEDFRLVKKPFRSGLAKSIAEKKYSDEIFILQEKNIPLLIVFGEDEKIVETGYLDDVALPLWQHTIFKIPGASHLVQVDQPKVFNELMKRFVMECFR
jgi:pimeloyl-ACP methyl ester carboxylesterase